MEQQRLRLENEAVAATKVAAMARPFPRSDSSDSEVDSDKGSDWGSVLTEKDEGPDSSSPCLRVGDVIQFNCLLHNFNGNGEITSVTPGKDNPVTVRGLLYPLPSCTSVKKSGSDRWYSIEHCDLIPGGVSTAGEVVVAGATSLRANLHALEREAVDFLRGRRGNSKDA